MVVVKVIQQLFLTTFMICVSAPDLHFYDILMSEIIYDHIRTCAVPGFGLNIVVARTVDDGFDIEHKMLAPFFFSDITKHGSKLYQVVICVVGILLPKIQDIFKHLLEF